MNYPESQRRFVITGMGVMAPNGQSLAAFWESIRSAHSAAGPMTRFPAEDSPVSAASERRL